MTTSGQRSGCAAAFGKTCRIRVFTAAGKETSEGMEQVSIIVPVFHGRKYIDSMIAQMEVCATACRGRCTLELLFVNDDPDEAIGSLTSEKIKIRVMETNVNRGIHGARVYGLEQCTGDYVLFLDQDDRIVPSYFLSQVSHLGKADAVVCKLLHEGRQYYDTRMPFEKVISREHIVGTGNSIISPGQVLIRKSKIPEIWRSVKLKNNGADDWLLWLCMLGTDAVFALNTEILFEHVVEGGNESLNTFHMMASEEEVYGIASVRKIFPKEELDKLRRAVEMAKESHIRMLSKFQKMFFIYDQWFGLQERGKYIHEFLRKSGISSVAIYGDSYIGKRLYHSLRGNGIEVKYFIDQNAEYLEEEIPVYLPNNLLPQVDRIIICLAEQVDEIRGSLTALSGMRVCSISELINDIRDA